jgi:outer membrane protein OmpA-like peptidoglycan-associated protein
VSKNSKEKGKFMQKKLLISTFIVALLGLTSCKRQQPSKPQTNRPEQHITMPAGSDSTNTKVSFFNDDVGEFEHIDTLALEEEQIKQPETLAWDEPAQVNPELKTVYFEYDSTTPRPDQQATLAQVSRAVNEWISKGYKVVFKGHACRWHGTRAYNLALSQERASSLARRLNLKSGTYSTFGVGNEELISFENTKDGQAPNRRVEIYPLAS